jgi:hypothetical protein
MAHFAPQADRRVSDVHISALCTEIGERLRAGRDLPPADLPPSLQALMTRLCDKPAASRA